MISDCCVHNCKNNTNGSIMFYPIPHKDEELCIEWKSRIGNNILARKTGPALKGFLICEEHFHYTCKTGFNLQLHENSLPTINLPKFDAESSIENCFLNRKEENDILDDRKLAFNLTIKDFPDICRICYSKGILYNIVDSKYKEQSIISLIQNLLPDQLPYEESFPKNVCLDCLKALIIANLLIKQILTSNLNFKNMLTKLPPENNTQLLYYPSITDLKLALFACNLKNDRTTIQTVKSDIVRNVRRERRRKNNNIRFVKRKRSLLRKLLLQHNSYKEVKIECFDSDIDKMSVVQLDIKEEDRVVEICDKVELDTEENHNDKLSIEQSDENCSDFEHDLDIVDKYDDEEDYDDDCDKKIKNRKKYRCDTCDLDFVGFRPYSRHNREKHPKSYICNVCNKKLASSEKLSLHRWTHQEMECNICHKKVKKTWFKGHMRTHEDDYKPKPWKKVVKLCPLCGKMLSTSAYKDHMAGHTGPKKYKCKLCSFASSFSANLRRHQALHTGAKPYLCTNCGYSCNQKAQLEVHSKQHAVSPTPLTCPFCPETFRTRYDRRLHSVRHSNGNTAAGGGLKPGNNGSGKTPYTAFDRKYYSGSQGQYVCPTCPTMCQNRVGLVRHLRNEHSDFDAGCLPCGYCDKKFSCQSSLGLHIRTQHQTATPYICEVCNKAFKSRPSLKEHVLIHTGERPHKCDLCPSAFRQHQHLTSHKLRMHDDRKPFSCDFCDKAFKCTFSLKEHVRIHTGETIKCEHCEKTFKQSSNKYKHMREVHNIRRSTPKST